MEAVWGTGHRGHEAFVMNKYLLRRVALLLVPCLVADPSANALAPILRSSSDAATAEDGRPGAWRAVTAPASPTAVFTQQALVEMLVTFGRKSTEVSTARLDREAGILFAGESVISASRRGFFRTLLLPVIAASSAGAQANVALAGKRSKTPLSPEQQVILRKRIDFFANRYSPEITSSQRQDIVERASIEYSLPPSEYALSAKWPLFICGLAAAW